MKKIIIILMILSYMLPVGAMCSIENNDTVCSLPNLRKEVQPIYKHSSNIKEFSSNPEVRLKPASRNNLNNEWTTFSPSESNYSYNTSCQFGVCLQNRSTPIFQKPVQ